MKEGRILLCHQLFHPSYFQTPTKYVVVSDHMWLTDEKPFNGVTLAHRFLSSFLYAKDHSFHRTWIKDHPRGPFRAACRYLKQKGVTHLCMFDPIEIPLRTSIERICKKEKLVLQWEDTPAFDETHEDLDYFLKEHPPKKKSYSHSVLYQWQRIRLNLLLNPTPTSSSTPTPTPLGGKWSFDTENRNPFPKYLDKEPIHSPSHSGAHPEQATILQFLRKRYKDNAGVLPVGSGAGAGAEEFWTRVSLFPLTHSQAKSHFQNFLKHGLLQFGPYEDAIHPNITFGYHSVISSCLNNGLLTPGYVLEQLRQWIASNTPLTSQQLASVEGFIRQVFGWRSYCRLLYREERNTFLRSNQLRHTKRLSPLWFKAPSKGGAITRIEWLDAQLEKAHLHAYSHHIVRLMVFSQWFLLMRIHPRDVLDWFWSVISIDAYEWVMIPNVLGMGQYADGGMMMTRPYVSASAYLEKMSRNTLQGMVTIKGKDYSWKEVWTALYYDFLMKHRSKLKGMYAYSRSYQYIASHPKKKQQWSQLAKAYRQLNGTHF
jgi:deoxyribodipyrimidine photolyase-related protein